jgi:hypothetical protein
MKSKPLLMMKKAAAVYDTAKRAFVATQNALEQAIEAYVMSVSQQVHAELLTLDWHAFKGSGARTELEAELPADGPTRDLFCAAGEYEREHARATPNLRINGVTVRRMRSGWNISERVRVSKHDLTTIGYKIKRPTNEARKKMVQILEANDLTPEQLKILLEQRKR